MQNLAATKGGKCLSTVYVNNKSKLEWECDLGHNWKTVPNKIQQGRWCPECKIIKLCANSIKELQEFATLKGGNCLSEQYKSVRTQYTWVCQNKHKWNASWYSIKEGMWCPYCHIGRNGNPFRTCITQLKEIAENKGGKCLSKTYHSRNKLEWECNKRHNWKATSASIKKGSWCPICAGNTRLTIHDMYKLSASKNGRCLSYEYTNVDTKLIWECGICLNKWLATTNKIKSGRWCPKCAHVKRGKSRRRLDYSRIQILHESGIKSSQIAETLNCSSTAIRKIIRLNKQAFIKAAAKDNHIVEQCKKAINKGS